MALIGSGFALHVLSIRGFTLVLILGRHRHFGYAVNGQGEGEWGRGEGQVGKRQISTPHVIPVRHVFICFLCVSLGSNVGVGTSFLRDFCLFGLARRLFMRIGAFRLGRFCFLCEVVLLFGPDV